MAPFPFKTGRAPRMKATAQPPAFDANNYPILPYGPHLPVDLQGFRKVEAEQEAKHLQILRDEELSYVWVNREDAKWVDVYKERIEDNEAAVEGLYTLPFLPVGL